MGLFTSLVKNGGDTDALLSSPFSDVELPPAVVLAEALGLELSLLPMDREAAIQIPAVGRSRTLLATSVAPLPLLALDGNGKVAKQPTFLYRSNGLENPYERLLWTVDDLLFHGLSLWAVERGAKTAGSAHGPILDAARVPFGRWSVKNGEILVRITPTSEPVPVPADQVILFNGSTNGLLREARDTLRAAQAIERAYVDRARNPIPITVIRHTNTSGDQAQLEEEEVKGLLANWKAARSAPDGAVGYLPPGLQMDTPGTDVQVLLMEARNAVRIDVANHVGIPVALLDGGVSEESMTYRNAQGETSRFYRDLAAYMDPIAHRLSMDDVVPRGQRIRFDLSAFDTPAPAPTGVPVED